MGPPDEATLDEWRAAFVRENANHMALCRALADLEAKLRQRPRMLTENEIVADWLAAILAQSPAP